MSLLQTKDLTIGYGAKIIQSGINLKLDGGLLVGLVGQNGVGKSTLLRTLAGFQKSLSGEIRIKNRSLEKISSEDRSKLISVVLTERPASLNLTTLDLIQMGRYPYTNWLGNLTPEDDMAIIQAVEDCQLEHVITRRLYELSDGQLQKVLVARALAQDTDLIILDEPTSHLDLRNKVEILDLLRRIATAGKGVLISTHEISLAAKVCDEFWCMDFDAEIEADKPDALIRSGRMTDILKLKKGIL